MKGAELLVETMVAADISRIFSLSGNQIMSIYDACIDAGIEIVHTRHEAAAVFMADAYAQLNSSVAVCLVTAAPGVANTAGSLYTARCAESPIVLLSGDSALQQDGKGAFQELDQVAMTQPLTKHSGRVQSVERLGADFAHAVQLACSGRPGPVHLALPVDLLESDTGLSLDEHQAQCADYQFDRPQQALDTDELNQLNRRLKLAEQPVILCGPAMSATRVGAALEALESAVDCPVIVMESPRGLNDPSLGNLAGVLNSADLIVSLGKRVDFTLGFGARLDCASWVIIDAEQVELDRARSNLGDTQMLCLQANPMDVCLQLTGSERGPAAPRQLWRSQVSAMLAERASVVVRDPVTEQTTKFDSASLCSAAQAFIDQQQKEVVVICDGGEFGQWCQAEIQGSVRLINGPSGAIGGGLCYAIAAAKAKPEALVIALMGDGTVGFHLAEFETAVRENASIVCIVGNDRRWNAEHLIQLRRYGAERLIGCDLSAARYDLAAQALGGHGEWVADSGQLDVALSRAVESNKAACINVEIDGLPAPTI